MTTTPSTMLSIDEIEKVLDHHNPNASRARLSEPIRGDDWLEIRDWLLADFGRAVREKDAA